MQQRENPDALAGQRCGGGALRHAHPYGFTELGTEASVKAMTRDELQAFWKQHFVPNNAALVVAGDITMAELRALVEQGLRRVAARARRPSRRSARRPTTAARLVIVDRPGAPQTQLRVAAIGGAALVTRIPGRCR